jgi:hypothetical protein
MGSHSKMYQGILIIVFSLGQCYKINKFLIAYNKVPKSDDNFGPVQGKFT